MFNMLNFHLMKKESKKERKKKAPLLYIGWRTRSVDSVLFRHWKLLAITVLLYTVPFKKQDLLLKTYDYLAQIMLSVTVSIIS